MYHNVGKVKASFPDMGSDELRELSLSEMNMKVCRRWNGDSHSHCNRDAKFGLTSNVAATDSKL